MRYYGTIFAITLYTKLIANINKINIINTYDNNGQVGAEKCHSITSSFTTNYRVIVDNCQVYCQKLSVSYKF